MTESAPAPVFVNRPSLPPVAALLSLPMKLTLVPLIVGQESTEKVPTPPGTAVLLFATSDSAPPEPVYTPNCVNVVLTP